MASSTRVRPRLALLALIVALAACSGGGARTVIPISKIHVVGDRHVDVTYHQPTCAVAAGHDVSYAADSITITMYSRQCDGCFGGVGSATEPVELSQAIAGRRLIDHSYALGYGCDAGFVSD